MANVYTEYSGKLNTDELNSRVKNLENKVLLNNNAFKFDGGRIIKIGSEQYIAKGTESLETPLYTSGKLHRYHINVYVEFITVTEMGILVTYGDGSTYSYTKFKSEVNLLNLRNYISKKEVGLKVVLNKKLRFDRIELLKIPGSKFDRILGFDPLIDDNYPEQKVGIELKPNMWRY